MKRQITYHIWPRELNFAEKLPLLGEFAKKRDMSFIDETFSRFGITFDNYSKGSTESFEEFLAALNKSVTYQSFTVCMRFFNKKRDDGVEFSFYHFGGYITVTINATRDDVAIIAHDFVKETFSLSNPPLVKPEEARAKNLQATIFLGKHFDEEAKESSQKLEQYLTLLRFRVVEAEDYRAEPIPDKVKRLINGQDIYIGLVTGQRDHTWLVAEAAYAHGKNKHVIMVVEDGAKFNPSLHGRDYEQIIIPKGTVERSFIKLLQEFRSIGISGL